MKLNYRKIGEGRPVIILHGLFGMSDNWQSIARRIGKKRAAYLIDQRNHGQSGHADAFNYDALVEDLCEFVADMEFDEICLIGHSMGGKVAMKYALRYPETVEKLVIVDIAPKAYHNYRLKDFIEYMREIDVDDLKSRREADQKLSQHIKSKPVRQFLLKNLDRDDDNNFSWKINLKSIYDNFDRVLEAVESSNTFKGDALFVHGGKSDYVLPEDHAMIKTLFPAAEIVKIENATHWLHADSADEFCKILRQFFDR